MEEANRIKIVNEDSLNDSLILLVDDNIDCLHMLGLFFRMSGYTTASATNGDEALLLLSEWPFKLMITDYIMPGMNGLRLCERAKMIAPELSIIMITGADQEQLLPMARKLGICAVLPKPFNLSELLAKVRSKKILRRIE